MQQRRIRIVCPPGPAEYLVNLLEGLQPLALRQAPAAALRVAVEASFLPNTPKYLEDRVEAWLNALDPEGRARLETAEDDGSWQPGWSAISQGVQVGSFFIRPPWVPVREALLDVVVDPRGGFGSGQHPTTQLALRVLERLHEAGRPGPLLDVGAGTGILAIAAARLGYAVTASEIEPQARAACQAQATRNGVPLELLDVDLGRGARTFRIVLANLAGLVNLKQLASPLRQALAPGGALLIGGFRRSEREQARALYEDLSLLWEDISAEGEWMALTLLAPS